MGSKSAPAPDYTGAAEAQGQASLENIAYQTSANRPNQYTPWGSSTWEQSGMQYDPLTGKNIPMWSQNISLSDQQQQALDSQMDVQTGRSDLAAGLIDRTGSELQDPFNWGGLPQAGATPESAYDPQFAQTAYDRQMSLMQPQMERATEAMDVQLRNQGLRPGTEAYDNAMLDLRNQQGEVMSRASQDALLTGTNLQQQQFGRDMQASNYQNQLRQQAIAEEAQRRGMSINEMNALLTGQQVQNPNMPQFSQAGAAQAPNYLGAAGMQHQANQDAYGNSLMGMLGGAGQAMAGGFGGAFGAGLAGGMPTSDKRLKTNIEKIGEMPSGIGIYKWEWNETGKTIANTISRIGVLAQEVMKVVPDAVVRAADGYYRVDYSKVV